MGDLLVTVHQHLLSVKQDPSRPLDELLLRKVDGNVAESLSQEDRTQLLGAVQELLPFLQQDVSNDQYLKGLESMDKDVNVLTLNLLNKAVASPSGIGLVASKADVVQAWIKHWLTTPNIAVAERAANVLENFLLAGAGFEQATVENNLMVRRVFHDRDIYESLFSLCSLKTLGIPGQPDKTQKTIAQARLLDFLVKIDHPGSPIRVSQFPDIERR